jgi:hypothetical protein
MKFLIIAFLIATSQWTFASVCNFESLEKKVCFGVGKIKEKSSEADCDDPSLYSDNIEVLRSIFDSVSADFKKRLCELDYLLVATPPDSFPAAAWADPFPQRYIALNKNLFQKDTSFAAISKRENSLTTNWMGRKIHGDPIPLDFGYDGSIKSHLPVRILFFVAHEMGHLLYRGLPTPISEKYFGETRQCLEKGNCPDFSPGTYGSISWADGRKIPELANDPWVSIMFRGHGKSSILDIQSWYLPKLNTETLITADQVNHFYSRLFAEGMTTGFSLASPEEDFCDTYANYVLMDFQKSWNFKFLDGSTIDIGSTFINRQNVKLKQRLDLIDALMAELNVTRVLAR